MAFRGRIEVHARHVLSDQDSCLPRAGGQESAGGEKGEVQAEIPGGARPPVTPRRASFRRVCKPASLGFCK